MPATQPHETCTITDCGCDCAACQPAYCTGCQTCGNPCATCGSAFDGAPQDGCVTDPWNSISYTTVWPTTKPAQCDEVVYAQTNPNPEGK